MSGDYSRDRFDRTKRFSGVLLQQGRVQLDSDWNEAVAIGERRWRAETLDLIGHCGVPEETPDGFKIEIDSDGALCIGRGRIYVDGYLAECFGAPPDAFDIKLEELRGTSALLFIAHPDFPDAESRELAAGRYLVFLNVWRREVTYLEDPDLVEPAVGVDTTTRWQTAWRVDLLEVDAGVTCQSPVEQIPAWIERTRPSAGRLSSRAVDPGADDSPCLIPPSGGYRGLENRLYRVEIHDGDDIEQNKRATFKWSRHNGVIATAVTAIPALDTLHVVRTQRDDVLRFTSGDWIEITDDWRELAGQPGIMCRIETVDDGSNTIRLTNPLPSGEFPTYDQYLTDPLRHTRVRRWDQRGAVRDIDGNLIVQLDAPDATGVIPVPAAGTSLVLEDGIEITLDFDAAMGSQFHPGDYWLIVTRTSGHSVEELKAAPPRGIHHHYCRLALVDHDGVRFVGKAQDCRPRFPPLTAITADDVSFAPDACGPYLAGAETVQEAIEVLCANNASACTLLVRPEPGWESILQYIEDGQDARLCFLVGDYPLKEPAVLAEKGHLLLTGSGPGTRILAPGSESVLRFENCSSVTVQDLTVHSGALGSTGGLRNLNGTLTFCGCGAVAVERVVARCAAGTKRAASCLTVTDTHDTNPIRTRSIRPTLVRVEDCDFEIGHAQIGVLLLNVNRARVENNRLVVAAKPEPMTFGLMLRDREYRAKVRKVLVSDAMVGVSNENGRDRVVVDAGGYRVSFKTDKILAKMWPKLVEENPPQQPIRSNDDLLKHIKYLADRVLVSGGRFGRIVVFRDWFNKIDAQTQAVASQGIVLGGHLVNDARIIGNSIEGVLQGVHVGVSKRDSPGGTPLRAGTVTIAGNHITIMLPPAELAERFGIFAGNCHSLLIEDNYARLKRVGSTGGVYVEGVRVWGHLGKRMILRQNHMEGFSLGTRIEPLNPDEHEQSLWLVAENVSSVKAPSTVQQSRNVA